MEKKRQIAILFGGCSPEYEVSLQSAYSVISHLNKDRYTLILLGISRTGEWFCFTGEPEKIKEDTWCNETDCIPAVLSSDRGKRGVWLLQERPGFLSLDAVFPVLHGKNGEDGTVQGLAELAGLPLIGCGVLASALCMDKDRAHRLVQAAGIRVPKAMVIESAGWKREKEDKADVQRFTEGLGYPLYVKPVKAGSSFGVTKVLQPEELEEAIERAFAYDSQVILEENIEGFEVGCAVLGTEELLVGEVDEIRLGEGTEGFFDFTEKYTLQNSAIYVPARIPVKKAEEIKRTAKQIYRVLGCSCFARVDMFLTPDGEIVFNEVNTIPGFTEHSRYPGMMRAAGYPIEEVLERICQCGLEG